MEHPAHQIAEMAADGTEELRGYLTPAAGLPWELTEDDHRDLMPRLCDAVARLAECIDSIAQVTLDDDTKVQLIEGARTILRGCSHIQAAGTVLPGEQRSPGPGAATRPPQLAVGDFPEPMTGHLLQAASANPASAAAATVAEAPQPASSPRR